MQPPPRSLDRWLAVAVDAHRAGRLEAACRRYDRVLRAAPDHPDGLHLKGLVRFQQGRADEALALIDRALTLAGDRPVFLANRALVLRALNDPAGARAAFQAALDLAPDDPDFALRLGRFEVDHGAYEAALAPLRRAVRLAPGRADIWLALASAARLGGTLDEALAAAGTAAELAPADPAVLGELALSLEQAGRLEPAATAYRAALAAGADSPAIWNNLGNCLRELGDLAAAIDCFEAALARDPHHVAARTTLGTCLLMRGDRRGWAAYESRLALPGQPAPVAPRWDGGPLEGTLLVRAEQGFGDILQFVRFAAAARARVGRLVLIAPRALVALLDGVAGVDQVVGDGAEIELPQAEVALLSLPERLGVEPWAPPAPVPYLSVDAARRRRWSDWLDAAVPSGLRVGIVWQGAAAGPVARGRSIPIAGLRPLLAAPGVRLVALQRGPGLDQVPTLPAGSLLVPGPEFDGGGDAFLDTAALLDALDLVVAPDTAVTHLAGALDRPVWVALKPAPHWPWRLDGSTSPWYPSARIYRQAAADGGWAPVMARIAADLAALAESKSSG